MGPILARISVTRSGKDAGFSRTHIDVHLRGEMDYAVDVMSAEAVSDVVQQLSHPLRQLHGQIFLLLLALSEPRRNAISKRVSSTSLGSPTAHS